MLCRKYVFVAPAAISAEPNCCTTVPETADMSVQGPVTVIDVPPEEPESADDPPLEPDDVDDPEASEPDGVPPEEEAPPEDPEPLDPEAFPPEVEPEPESFGVSDEAPVPPIGPQATPVKRTTV